MIQLCHQIIHSHLGKTHYTTSVSEKIKAINYKFEQNKAQYNLGGEIAKIFALSSGNVSKYVLPAKDVLEKAAAIKRFEYSPSGKELKK